MTLYKLRLMQDLYTDNKAKCYEFCVDMQYIDGFFNLLAFGDVSTFQTSGKVNRYSVRYGEWKTIGQQ